MPSPSSTSRQNKPVSAIALVSKRQYHHVIKVRPHPLTLTPHPTLRNRLTVSSRFGRDPRASLFAGYEASTGQSQSRQASKSPGRQRPANSYGYPGDSSSSTTPANAYPYANGSTNGSASTFRSATPNKKGQYSDAVLNELESQNDAQLEGMSAKVKMLKDVSRDKL